MGIGFTRGQWLFSFFFLVFHFFLYFYLVLHEERRISTDGSSVFFFVFPGKAEGKEYPMYVVKSRQVRPKGLIGLQQRRDEIDMRKWKS